MMQCLDYIAHVVAEIERPFLEEQVNVVKHALAKVPKGQGFPSVLCLPESRGSSHKTEMHPLFAVTLGDPSEPPAVTGRPTGRGDEWITWKEGAG